MIIITRVCGAAPDLHAPMSRLFTVDIYVIRLSTTWMCVCNVSGPSIKVVLISQSILLGAWTSGGGQRIINHCIQHHTPHTMSTDPTPPPALAPGTFSSVLPTVEDILGLIYRLSEGDGSATTDDIVVKVSSSYPPIPPPLPLPLPLHLPPALSLSLFNPLPLLPLMIFWERP